MTFVTIERHDPEAGIKVVPMYIEGDEVEESGEGAPDDAVEQPARDRGPALGIAAMGMGVLTAAALVTGIVMASAGGWAVATIVAYVTIGLSVLAVALGVTALILGRGRSAATIAVVLGVVANPLVLLFGLRLLGGVETG